MTPWTIAYQAPLWGSPGRHTTVGCHALFQWIFPIQGWKPHLLCLLFGRGSLPLVPPQDSQFKLYKRAHGERLCDCPPAIRFPAPGAASAVSHVPSRHAFMNVCVSTCLCVFTDFPASCKCSFLCTLFWPLLVSHRIVYLGHTSTSVQTEHP